MEKSVAISSSEVFPNFPPSYVVEEYAPGGQYPDTVYNTKSWFKKAEDTFDNPYAFNEQWHSTYHDVSLSALPNISIELKAKQRYSRRHGDQFNPPARSFMRDPGANPIFAPTKFEPISIPTTDESNIAGRGFKTLYPGDVLALHDVSSADWARFLDDIAVAARLPMSLRSIPYIGPISLLLFKGIIEKPLLQQKDQAIFETVETWQRRFFSKRGLEIYLAKGNQRLTGRSEGDLEAAAQVPSEQVRLIICSTGSAAS